MRESVVGTSRWDARLETLFDTRGNELVREARSDRLAALFLKAALNESSYDEPLIQNEVEWDNEMRRAISSISNYYNVLGIFRRGFDLALNNKLAANAYYAVCEKGMMDYIGSAQWMIVDREGNTIDDEMDWLEKPNPQQRFSDVLKAMLPDLFRYDAGVIVKTFTLDGFCDEIKSYYGPEFWMEIDRVPVEAQLNPTDRYIGYWSRGYVQRYWQRSRTGIYISFKPDELAYAMMYPKSDDVYGTDQISKLKWQIQYLIDSTKAAGRAFENGAVPSIVWNHGGMTNPQVLKQRIAEVEADIKGPLRVGAILHTLRDEKVETLAQTLHEMEWLEGQLFVAQLIWSMFGFSVSEFMEGSGNRSTAYIQRNITKSRFIRPVMGYLEEFITTQILPYREGYQPDWKFKFLHETDLDDVKKQSEILASQVNVSMQLFQAGLPLDIAMNVAGMEEDVIFKVSAAQMLEMPMQAVEGYEAQTLVSGEDPMRQSGDNAEYAGTEAKEKDIEKGRIYVTDPSQTPKGVRVIRGPRGAMFYESADEGVKQQLAERREKDYKKPKPHERQHYAGTKVSIHGGGETVHERNLQRPSGPVRGGSGNGYTIRGDGIEVTVVRKASGLTTYYHKDNESRKIAEEVQREIRKAGRKDMGTVERVMKDVAERHDLELIRR